MNGLDVGFCVEYKFFFFWPIISDHVVDKSRSKFLQSKNFVPVTVNLGQTLENIEIEALMHLGPTILPMQFIHDN